MNEQSKRMTNDDIPRITYFWVNYNFSEDTWFQQINITSYTKPYKTFRCIWLDLNWCDVEFIHYNDRKCAHLTRFAVVDKKFLGVGGRKRRGGTPTYFAALLPKTAWK